MTTEIPEKKTIVIKGIPLSKCTMGNSKPVTIKEFTQLEFDFMKEIEKETEK